MTGAQLIIECLKAHGVTDLFGYPGGAIMPTYDASMTQVLTISFVVTNKVPQ